MKTYLILTRAIALAVVVCVSSPAVRADAVTDWNATLATALKASGLGGNGQARPIAIVNAAIFDAVNGIARKYEPYVVCEDAPLGASKDAAAVQAAYTALLALFPTQQALFDAQLATSLTALTGSSQSIAAGRAWGESVALDILEWRATDGVRNSFTYLGGSQVGCWRTPTAGLSGISVNLGTMVPFAMKRPTQFRSEAPYGSVDRLAALTTAEYAADLNEVKAYGSATSAVRTAEQADLARFWHAEDPSDEIRAIISVVPPHAKLVDNARLFALCGLVMGDAAIACFDSKYAYALWRPIDAVRLADTDDNPATEVDAAWTPLINPTPRHPEYPSAHCIFTSGMFATAAMILGDDHTFVLNAPTSPSVTTRTFTSFSAAINEVVEARIWAGIHFRTACDEGRATGRHLARFVVKNFLRPRHHDRCDNHRN